MQDNDPGNSNSSNKIKISHNLQAQNNLCAKSLKMVKMVRQFDLMHNHRNCPDFNVWDVGFLIQFHRYNM